MGLPTFIVGAHVAKTNERMALIHTLSESGPGTDYHRDTEGPIRLLTGAARMASACCWQLQSRDRQRAGVYSFGNAPDTKNVVHCGAWPRPPGPGRMMWKATASPGFSVP
jgi:hypothetical protein